MKMIFFSIISLFVIFSASMQVWLYINLHEKCSKVSTAPLVAAGCLFGSFITIFLWRISEKRNWKCLSKVCIFDWVILLCVGMISVGITFGQSLLYSDVCPALDNTVKDDSVQILQIFSGICLILSVAIPHVYKSKSMTGDNKQNEVNDNNEGIPKLSSDNSNGYMYKPLIFVK